jgi:hypothetical protein
MTTAANTFTTAYVPWLNGQACWVLRAKDFFDEALVKALIQFLRGHEEEVAPEEPTQILEGFHHPGYGFDSVLVRSPKGHERYVHELPKLQPRAFLAFPIYRCEFTGDESLSQMEMICKDFVPTLDWKRAPACRLYMRYNNTETGGGSKGKKLGLAKMDSLRIQLNQLTSKKGSFIEIKNFKGQQCRLVVSDDSFEITGPGLSSSVSVPRKKILAWVDCFLSKGLEACPK